MGCDGLGTRAVASPLESARFGCSVERLTVHAEHPASFTMVREAVLLSAADVIVLRYPADRVDWFAKLALLGRTAIFADSLSYWRLRPGDGRRPESAQGLRTTTLTDAAAVATLVSEIFAAYGSHYSANPLFGATEALAGYQEWALRSAAEGSCLALGTAAAHLGLATLDEQGPRTEILLAGVVPEAQGQGLYAHLLKGIEDGTLARGAEEILISTQVHNTRVQRAWARYGFEPVSAVLTVHLVKSRRIIP
ncbi:GNAT family N-acetyltransferase [Sphaerisporangium sp. NPDC049002]|uniref:GNAT family N-acetyltransferase n=1 Tax=Sphaerisporangium sp. NPDC049002 TaxID=3155392 RepID=UPI003405DD9B